MKYYYFDPLKKQYYFPENYKEHTIFNNFYQPYTLKGWVLWQLWNGISFIRELFEAKEIETFLPVENLTPYLAKQHLLAYNRGTVGVEQKITVLGVDTETNEKFFIKYAETEIARINVRNEGEVLKQLEKLDFVPQLKQFVNTDTFTFIQTNVLKGKRIRKQNIDKQLLDILFKLAELKLETKRNYTTELICSFAHGDFCPWNMMLDNKKLTIFDWEMAGIYPLGYDLFTYIFQTSFLLSPITSLSYIIQSNKLFINQYFNRFKISDWNNYLIAFAKLKLQLETEKQNKRLVPFYNNLITYAQKI